MDPKTKEKLKKLRDYWFDDEYSLKFVDTVEKTLRKIMVKEKLAGNKAVQAILADVKDRIKAIDTMLIYDEEMTELERKLLMREKKVHGFYLNRFDGKNVDEQFESVGKLLDEELERTGLKVADE